VTSNPPEPNEEAKGAPPFGTGYDEPRSPRWLAPLPIGIGVFLIVLILLGAWLILRRRGAEPEVEPIVEVEVAPSERVEMREYVEAGGTLNALPGHEASFSSASAGRASRVLVQVGQHVRAGQTMAELDRSVLAAQVRQAQATLQQAKSTAAQARTISGAPSQTIASDQIKQAEAVLGTARANETLAQSNLARQRRLFERGIAPRKDVDDAETQAKVTAEAAHQAESALTAARVNATRGIGDARTQASVTAGAVEAAQAALDMARAQFALAAIRSPIAGTVTKRAINDGESVDPATPAFEVIDSASLDLVANMPAGYLDRIKTGDMASVHVESLPDKEFTGGVVQVAPAVDSQTNTVAVRVRLANPSGELKSGLYATAHIAVQIHQNAIVVPDSALVIEGDDSFVFVPKGDKVEKRKVTVGIRGDKRAEITEGLKEGERVVTTGAFGLGDGTKIKIVQAEKKDEGGDKSPVGDKEK
jgi:multidrug efflux pump subunit AcrA (membrane-fusion protein)